MKYITVKEAVTKWGISERRIRQLVKGGRINGAIKIGQTWNIPADASKPIDKRIKNEEYFKIDLTDDFWEKIDKKKTAFKNKRLALSNKKLKYLEKNEILKLIYNLNSIEGNTLTYHETKCILDGIAIGGKLIKEHLEVINNKEAIRFIKGFEEKKKSLNEEKIKNINKLVLRGINNENAGKYRIQNDILSSKEQEQIETLKIPEQMEQLMIDYDGWCEDYYSIETTALLYGEFLKISPFVAENGLTARLLINLENILNDYPLIIIKNNIKRRHDKALEKAQTTGDYTDLVKIIAKANEDAMNLYLRAI